MSLRPKPAVVRGKASRLDVVLRAGASLSAAGEKTAFQRHVLGVLNMDAQVMMSVRGLLSFLQLCQLSGSTSAYLYCNDRDVWKELLRVSSEKLTDMSAGVLKSVSEVDAIISGLDVNISLDDRKVANIYKREFTRHVLYNALYGDSYSPMLVADDVRFELIWFADQIETFLRRSNGSMTNIVKKIQDDMTRIRRRDPDFPPVPSDFYVGAIEIVAEVINNRSTSQSGRSRLPELVAFVRKADYY